MPTRGISTLLGAVLCLQTHISGDARIPRAHTTGFRGVKCAKRCRPPARSAVAQERRDVDLVVGDLERRAFDARAAVAAAGAVARLLARGARAGAAVVEAG